MILCRIKSPKTSITWCLTSVKLRILGGEEFGKEKKLILNIFEVCHRIQLKKKTTTKT